MHETEAVGIADVVLMILAGILAVATVLGVLDSTARPGAASVSGGLPVLAPPPLPSVAAAEQTRVLLVGADDRHDRGRADCIIVATINTRTGRLTLLSIPRDTRTQIPSHGRDKINHAYRFGGMPLLQATVEQLLAQHLDRYVKLDFQTFAEAVDILGGVVIEVRDVEGHGRGMNYDDNAGRLHIHLRPGRQRLNGEQAMGYVRYRRDGDDKRTQRQREFLQALVRQHLRATRLAVVMRAARHVLKKTNTNISYGEAAALAGMLARVSSSSVMEAQLPVHPAPAHGIYYSEVDEARARELLAKMDAFLAANGTPHGLAGSSVAVYNGSGRPGAAQEAAQRIIRAQAHVTATRNAERFSYGRTVIIYHSNYRRAAEELREVLGVPGATLRADDAFDAPGAASVAVIVGKDMPARRTPPPK